MNIYTIIGFDADECDTFRVVVHAPGPQTAAKQALERYALDNALDQGYIDDNLTATYVFDGAIVPVLVENEIEINRR